MNPGQDSLQPAPVSNLTSIDPTAVFEKYGLKTRRWGTPKADLSPSSLPLPARFRNALEELGGLHTEFACFLAWRADILRTDYLGHLRQVRCQAPSIPRAEFERILQSELPSLSVTLESEPCWSTLSRCAYRAKHEGRWIAVQIARDPVPDREIERAITNLAALDEPSLGQALKPELFEQFRQWLRLADSPARERSYLDALHALRDRTLVQYPTLLRPISTDRVLCFEWTEGEPVGRLIAEGKAEAVQRVAEYVLEQICTVSAIDADLDPEAIVLTRNGRLALRRASRLISIPPALAGACLKYISAVLAANAPAAANQLVKLASGRTALHLESQLLDELSNLEPELKVNLQFPASTSVFEGNWRALTNTGIAKPLFLDAMHRNLIATGYWNAETTAAQAPVTDFIAEAQWPVLEQMLRTRVGELLNRDTASDWFLGSGLLFFESIRQLNRVAEEIRENEISVGVDLQTPDQESKKTNRAIRQGVFIGMLVVLFLVTVKVAASEQGVLAILLSITAAAMAFALFWFVSRFD